MSQLQRVTRFYPSCSRFAQFCSHDKTGQDSGGQGSIRQAGGAFAKMEIAHEEEYFYKLRLDQLHLLKEKQQSEHQFRENSIKQHIEAIERHQKAIEGLNKEEK